MSKTEQDKLNHIIKEISVRHGIAVGKDDPILVLHTINEMLMKDSAQAQQEQLDKFKSELELISHRWGEDAKNKAERILNSALQSGQNAMQRNIQEYAIAVTELTKKELQRMDKSNKDLKMAVNISMVASGLTIIAAMLVLYASR